MSIAELYSQRQYYKLLDEHLSDVLNRPYNRDDSNIEEKIDDLVKTLYSCFFCGAYAEILKLLEVVASIHFVTWNVCQANFLQFEFIALLYYLFNPEDYEGEIATIQPRIDRIIPRMKEEYQKAGVEL